MEERRFSAAFSVWTRRGSAPVVVFTRLDPKKLQRYGFFFVGKYFFSIDATTT